MFNKILFLFGGSFILLAIFANQLGIDNDVGWGRGRVLLLETGGAFALFATLLFVFQKQVENLQTRISNFSKVIERERKVQIIVVLVGVLIACTYVWILNPSERQTDLTYNFFGELAKGFKQGNLYIPQAPSEALLALSNPYDTIQRKQSGIEDFPWDVSLYKGRFYLYWGPTPALLLLPFSNEMLSKIEDFQLTAVFAIGLFIYSVLIVTSFWESFKKAPLWVLVATILVLGFPATITTMLKRAEIHEVAVFASQFFFIGGCYWAYSAIKEGTPPTWKYVLAGIHWSLAIGARAVILPAVIIGVFIFAWPFLSGFHTNWKKHLGYLLAIGLPVALGGISLAWYNYTRFGSIFEFGIRYQLTNVDYTQFNSSFGFQYFIQNLKVYFLYPINFKNRFPFISLSEYKAATNLISGLLYISPLITLLLFPLFRLLTDTNKKPILPACQYKLLLIFTGATLASALIILNFFFITIRYTLDFLPSALLLVALSFGMEFDTSKENRLFIGILSFFFVILSFVNITAGILLAVPKSGVDFMLNLLNDISKITGLK